MQIPIRAFAELPSTNAEALRLLLADEVPPFWVTAERQTAGRGRSGRSWVSEPGNLYASLGVRLTCAPAVLHQLSFVAAVATIAALKRVAGEMQFKLKWPNDVLLDGAKLTGILAESTLKGDAVLAVIGIGINLVHAPTHLGRATTHLREHGHNVSAIQMLTALSNELAAELVTWRDGAGFSDIRARWLANSLPMGTAMSVKIAEQEVHGTFVGLDAGGALILADASGTERVLTFGDVTVTAAPGDKTGVGKDLI